MKQCMKQVMVTSMTLMILVEISQSIILFDETVYLAIDNCLAQQVGDYIRI